MLIQAILTISSFLLAIILGIKLIKYFTMHRDIAIHVAIAHTYQENKTLGVTALLIPVIGQWLAFFQINPQYKSAIPIPLVIQFMISLIFVVIYTVIAFRITKSTFWLIALTLFVLGILLGDFSGLYWNIGDQNNWSMTLGHIDAIYVAMGILTTAGTGNIVPLSEIARSLILLQMVIDFFVITVLIAFVADNIIKKLTNTDKYNIKT